jgi:4-amino-4-deoxy-L-arabinose transferase-like glycosyltransferase
LISDTKNNNWQIYGLLIVGVLLNVPGLLLDIIEPDGALYATIAKHIVLHDDWVNLFGDGHDWLDKPHFPFWMAAISYKVLGITGFAYKFPAFLFWIVGVAYTYLTARDLYSKPVAWLSILIYVTALHSTLFNFDVRAEPYLTTCIIAAIWHMLKAARGSLLHLVLAALFAACAIMTKGIFVLATIGGGWVAYWLLSKQWKEFLNYRWWLLLALCLVFILPELYALYAQFDLHPEKVVFGRTNVSGLRFFFWDSQFGRFFNTGPIKGSGSPAFFLHTSLWAFLPWSAALVAGLVYLLRFDRVKNTQRWVLYGSAFITFLLFSLSSFQLPHYILILFPHFSIISAYFLYEQRDWAGLKVLSIVQGVTLVVTAAIIIWLLVIMELANSALIAGFSGVIVLAALFIKRRNHLESFIYKGYGTAVVMYVFLFLSFYPHLLQYQAGRQAARKIPTADSLIPAATYNDLPSHTFEFYAPQDVQVVRDQASLSAFLAKRPCYLYTTKQDADSLLMAGVRASVVVETPYYRITKLKLPFLRASTRSGAVQLRTLLYLPLPEPTGNATFPH